MKKEHVDFVVDFLYRVYQKESLGYYDFSMQMKKQEEKAKENEDTVKKIIKDEPEIGRIFYMNQYLSSQNISDMIDQDLSTVRDYISQLSKYGMITKTSRGQYKKSENFTKLLRNLVKEGVIE